MLTIWFLKCDLKLLIWCNIKVGQIPKCSRPEYMAIYGLYAEQLPGKTKLKPPSVLETDNLVKMKKLVI